jgi:hypothetical protein
MLPVGSNNKSTPCSVISSNCVSWQGPDIPCIGLCKGDTVTDVVSKLGELVCDIDTRAAEVSVNVSCLGGGDFVYTNYNDLIQYITDKLCDLYTIVDDLVIPTPISLICDVAPCLQAEAGATTLPVVEYAELIGNEFSINVDDSFMMLGMNSCTKIDLMHKLGNIPIIQFENEFLQFENENNLKMIACFHHNFTSAHENKNNGQWETDNRESFIQKLVSNGIEFTFTGNEHTNSCKSFMLGVITASDSGCFSSKTWDTTFKVYEVIKGEDILLKNIIYSLDKPNNNDFKYVWDIRNNKNHYQTELFTISKKNPPFVENEIFEIPSNNTDIDLKIVEEDNSTKNTKTIHNSAKTHYKTLHNFT